MTFRVLDLERSAFKLNFKKILEKSRQLTLGVLLNVIHRMVYVPWDLKYGDVFFTHPADSVYFGIEFLSAFSWLLGRLEQWGTSLWILTEAADCWKPWNSIQPPTPPLLTVPDWLQMYERRKSLYCLTDQMEPKHRPFNSWYIFCSKRLFLNWLEVIKYFPIEIMDNGREISFLRNQNVTKLENLQ